MDQNTVRQLDGVQLDKAFTDKASGKDTNRPQLKPAMDYLRDGDVLVVHSLAGWPAISLICSIPSRC